MDEMAEEIARWIGLSLAMLVGVWIGDYRKALHSALLGGIVYGVGWIVYAKLIKRRND